MTRRTIAMMSLATLFAISSVGAEDAKKAKAVQDGRFEEIGEQLKQAVAEGKLTKEEASAKFKELAAGVGAGKGKGKTLGKGKAGKGKVDNGKMMSKRKGSSDGRMGFYAVVIGRLKSKDVELGEFTMEVDHVVTTKYGGARVKDLIVGKTVFANGVSGQMLDNLLLMKRGETLKFRCHTFQAPNTILGGGKFPVLERVVPFDPDAYGVLPDDFRGFRGVLTGKIAELDQAYELTLRVDKVERLLDGNTAEDAGTIVGKLVRIDGFYAVESTFADLHVDDNVRVGAIHSDRALDTLEVNKLLEKVVGQD